ncbi:uncharacterized protein Z518_08520 [Rhinocladiella mackenziei CBS 650.93]|uniref:AB hydrolase-1 domain-containing protein n=1 Tax=Rhinocladiella mackenziei CBS 650.93 TaxID=1442369 RepID=A0A0D2I9P0_9EURO|nr:uncharacterized protein Z518_08520 [Rhinocladiella mackenziei CBS 650.93]KIX02579.1 hypothetical protein Z518_08520 [Rhinocladiella mackenziei CBS 650.93]
MLCPSSQQFLTPNGTNIHYIASGNIEGPLFILLHGLGGSTETFRDLIPCIPKHRRVIAVDIEGFGNTSLNQTQPLSFLRYVSDLHFLISHLQKHSAPLANTSNGSAAKFQTVFMGHSLGAIISLHYASKYPAEVGGLLLLGVGRSVRGIPAAQQRMRDLAATAREKGMDAIAEVAVKTNFPADREREDNEKEQIRIAVASCNAEAYAQTAELVASDDHFDPDYNKISCPCVFVAGDGDMISPVQRSKDISGLLGGPSEVVIVKSGHQMILQDMNGVKSALDRFLSGLEGP